MPDREKVISDLQEQIDWIRDNEFHKFPSWGHTVLVMKDALNLLEEQQNQIWEMQDRTEYLEDKLNEQPQIVRCKDCKHGRESILAYRKGCVWCERVNRHNDADWFCADGKRQEGR